MKLKSLQNIGIAFICTALLINVFLVDLIDVSVTYQYGISTTLSLTGVLLIFIYRYKKNDTKYFLGTTIGLLSLILMVSFYFLFVK
jgi:hypothetical protein